MILIGDSITRDGRYQNYLDAFLMTRHPDSYIEIVNGGDDGDTAAGFLSKRFKYEIQENKPAAAFVCFGANDAGIGLYPGDNEVLKEQQIAGAKANLENIIKGLKEEGVEDITLLTPVTYDDRANYNTVYDNHPGYSNAMSLIAANVLELAEKYDLKVVNTNTLTTAIMENAIKEGSTGEEIFQTDRIHPNTRGHFVIASKIIETLYGDDAIVASVDVDAAAESISSENADVSELTVSDGGVSYTYLAKSLPMGVDDAGYEAVHELYGEYVNFTNSMNREIIKVTNLAEGGYAVSFDGVKIGEYTGEELSEGINIAVNPLNPGQVSAKEVIDLLMTNLYNFQRVRIFEIFENNLKRAGMYEGTTLEQKLAWAEENEPLYKTNIKNYYPQKDEYVNIVNKAKRDAFAKAQPVPHTVTIVPVIK